jgi:NADH-quinone oxidoreductase subunit E
MSFEFTAENKAKLAETLTRYPNKQAALLPALWLAQQQHGHLSLEVQEYVAAQLGLHPAHVYGVVTFYTMFKTKPVGRYHLQICRTLSCALRGCGGLIDQVQDKLAIKPGEVTRDGRFSLELVECLASCGTAPAMMVNEALFEELNHEKLDQLLEKLP